MSLKAITFIAIIAVHCEILQKFVKGRPIDFSDLIQDSGNVNLIEICI